MILYVFQFIDGIVLLPLYVQQLIRLREISERLRAPLDDASAQPA